MPSRIDTIMRPSTSRFGLRQAWGPMLVALVVLGVLLGFSPNWKSSDQVRTDPLGGDFLQEWIGGRIILDGNYDALYTDGVFRPMQHDHQLLGFQWDADRYFPMVYPPFHYVQTAGLARLSYPVAATLWLCLLVLALSVVLMILRSLVGGKSWVLLIVLATPLLVSLNMGQKSVLLLLIFSCAYALLKMDRPLIAGALFALATFKPHFVIVIGLIMLLQRQWLFVGGCSLVVLSQLISCAILGPVVCQDYINVCIGMGDFLETSGYRLEKGFSLWGGWQMILGHPFVVKMATILSSATVLSVLVFFARPWRKPEKGREIRLYLAALMATPLIAPHFYDYDLTILLLPASLFVASYTTDTRSPLTKRILLGCFVGLLGLTPLLTKLTAVLLFPIGSIVMVFGFRLLGKAASTKRESSAQQR